ncbi:MAG TPA: type II secretion system F family protein [Bacillota bacterium]|nr:type II secretion system F family protein [Bacillota bacterium]
MNLQFKDALYYLASALSAGKSLESALRVTLRDLQVMYGEEDCLIIRELTHICQRLELNEPLESCLQELAQRSGLEDILHFSQVISICKRSGGNLVDVVKQTSAVLSEKIEISHDIQLQLTKQKFEQKLLNLMPFVFMGLMKLGGGGYLEVLYTSVAGYLSVGVAVLLLGAAWATSRAILDIRV